MRRENKYGTNRSIRFCQASSQKGPPHYFSDQQSLNRRDRWKIVNLLRKHMESPDYSNKIVLHRNYNFYQYNGYKTSLRENPRKHLSFARRLDFTYQPYVNYIKVNQTIFNSALRHGWKFLNNKNNFEQLLDIDIRDSLVTLIYFIDSVRHFISTDWFYAYKHAFGGYFADYHTVCWGDYCPFGPKISGQEKLDSRITQVIFVMTQNNKRERYGNYLCDYWKCSINCTDYHHKTERSKRKDQRRSKHILTKQAKTAEILY